MATESLSDYKTGTITSFVNGDRMVVSFTDSNDAIEASDVGRILYITQSNGAKGRYRRITVANTLDGHYEFDAPFSYNDGTNDVIRSPFEGETSAQSDSDDYDAVNERPIAVGDTFTISRTWAEVASTNADVTEVQANELYRVSDVGISTVSGVVIYDEDVTVSWRWTNTSGGSRNDLITLADGSAIIFGRQNFSITTGETGYTSNGCTLIERATRFVSSNSSKGAFHMNGGIWYGTSPGSGGTNEGIFYRFNANNDDSMRFWNVQINNTFGGRVAGNYSVFLDNTFTGNVSANGPIASVGVSIFNRNTVNNGYQAAYFYPQLAGSSTLEGTSVKDITDHVIRLVESSGADTDTTSTLADWDFDEINQTTLDDNSATALISFEGDAGGSGDHTVEFTKKFKLDFTEADGGAISDDNAAFYFESSDSSSADISGTTTNGSLPEQDLLAYDTTFENSSDSTIASLALMTDHVPWTWAAKYRNHLLITSTTDLAGPVGRLEQSLPRVIDNTITETDTSVVDAYTVLNNSQEAYDYADKFKYDNMQYPTVGEQFFTRNGETLTATDGYDIQFDHDITDVFTFVEATGHIIIKTPSTGFLGNVIVSDDRDVTVDAVIRGGVTATNIFHSFTDGDTIANTDQALDATISLPAGTYTIRDADVSNLTINRSGSGTVTVNLVGTTGTPTTGTDVTAQQELQTILQFASGDTLPAVADVTARATDSADGTPGTFADVAAANIAVDSSDNTITISQFVSIGNTHRWLGIAVDGYQLANVVGEQTDQTIDMVAENNVDFDITSFTLTSGLDLSDTTVSTIASDTGDIIATINGTQGAPSDQWTEAITKASIRRHIMESDQFLDALAQGFVTTDWFTFRAAGLGFYIAEADRFNYRHTVSNTATYSPDSEVKLITDDSDQWDQVSTGVLNTQILFVKGVTGISAQQLNAVRDEILDGQGDLQGTNSNATLSRILRKASAAASLSAAG